mgnify:FL=1
MKEVNQSLTFLSILEIIGFTGVDRIYMKCYKSGFFKLLLFLIFSLLVFIETNSQKIKENCFFKISKNILEFFIFLFFLYDLILVSRIVFGQEKKTFCNQNFTDFNKTQAKVIFSIVLFSIFLFFYYYYNF